MFNIFKKIVATGSAADTITVQDKELTVVKQIGEGGNAEILLTRLTKPPKTLYALKRMSVHRDDKAKLLIAQWEFHLNTALPAHTNIVRCEAAQVNKLPNGDSEFLMLLEYCNAGTLLDYINAHTTPNYKELMTIFGQLCAAVAVFHTHQPPISHRDLKPENVLKSSDGLYKLCDFGSATTDTFLTKTAAQRNDVQAILEKNTTPSYRAPEMCDLFRAQPINEASDVWALGVVLYQLLFREQPFADGPLAVVSGKYRLPDPNPTPKEIMNLLSRMLCMDVAKRATVTQVQLAIQEITGIPAVQAKPWTLGFTTASLAAKVMSGKSTGRASPMPAANQLTAPPTAVRETSKSGNSKRKPLPAVPAYDGGDFNPSFPPTAATTDSRAETGFVSPELMKIPGALQWEESSDAKEEKKSSQKREVSVSAGSRTSANSHRDKADEDLTTRESSATRPEPADVTPPNATTPIPPSSPSPAPESASVKRTSVVLSPPPPPPSAGRSRGSRTAQSPSSSKEATKKLKMTSEEFAKSLSINGASRAEHLGVPTSQNASGLPTSPTPSDDGDDRGLIKSKADLSSEALVEEEADYEDGVRTDKATPLRPVEVEDGRLPHGVVRKSQSFGDLAGNKSPPQEDEEEEDDVEGENDVAAHQTATTTAATASSKPTAAAVDDFGAPSEDDPFATATTALKSAATADDFDSFDPFSQPTTAPLTSEADDRAKTDAADASLDATEGAPDDDNVDDEAGAHAAAQSSLHADTSDSFGDSFGSEPAQYNAETYAFAQQQATLAAQAHAQQIAEQYDPATAAAYYRQLQAKYASDPHYAAQAALYAEAAEKAEAAAALAATGGSEPANLYAQTTEHPPVLDLPAMPVLDPRENDYLQYRYVTPTSERDEFLLISPRDVIHSDPSLPLESIEEAVTKATKKDSGPPRTKYIRQLIVTSWKHRMDSPQYHASAGEEFDAEGRTAQGWIGLPELFDVLNERPVAKHTTVAFKTLFLIHRLMQHGSPAVIGQLFVGRQFILALQQGYSNNAALTSSPLTSASPIHDLIVPYCAYLLRRIYFIYQYRQFEGNFSLGYYLYRLYRHPGWPHEWTMPVTITRDQVMALITTLHSGLALSSLVVDAPVSVLQNLETEAVQLRDGILIPLMDDLYAMWLAATFLLTQLTLFTGAQPFAPGQAPNPSRSTSEEDSESDAERAEAQSGHLKSPTAGADTSSSLGPGATASEEDSVCAALTNLIAAHREVTIRLHAFFNAVRSLPIIAASRRQPAMPGRVNPFQPTPLSLFPPPSNIPRLGLENPQLVWRFQHQCMTAGSTKSRFISVDEELMHYHHQVKMAEQQQLAMMHMQQQPQVQEEEAAETPVNHADDNPFDEVEYAAATVASDAVAIPPFSFPSMPTDGSMSVEEYQYRLGVAQQQYAMAVHQHQQMIQQSATPPQRAVAVGIDVNSEVDTNSATVLSPFHGLPLNEDAQPIEGTEVTDSLDFLASPSAIQSQSIHPTETTLPTQAVTAIPVSQSTVVPLATQPIPAANAAPAHSPTAASSSSSIADDIPPFEDEIDIAEVELSSRVRSSKYTQLYSGHWQGNDVAIQRIAPTIYNTPDLYKEFRHELNVRRKLRHPHLVLFLGASTVPGKICIVTELVDSNLTALLADEDVSLSWAAHLQIALDMAKAVSYLHQSKPQPIIHRALNPISVLIDSASNRAKLSEFGLSRVTAFESAADNADERWKWTAPEVLAGSAATEKCDVYSFAILLWQLASHQVPYDGLDPAETAASVMKESFRPTIPSTTPADYAQLIQACWQQLTMLRPTFSQIVEALTAMIATAKAQKKGKSATAN